MYDKRAIKFYENGRSLQQAGRLGDAERAYRKAIKINTNFFEAHNNLGNVQMELGRLKQAVASYRSALQWLPNHPMLLNNLGNALQLQGRDEKAVEYLRDAIRLQPDYADAQNNLGNALHALGEDDEAVLAYREAVRLDPGLVDAHNNLGNILLEQQETDSAIAEFREAVRLEPRHRDAWYGLGNALWIDEQADASADAYRRAIAIEPRHIDAHLGLGRALLSTGDYDGAIDAFTTALEIDQNCVDAHVSLGETLSTLGQYDDAISAYRHALAIDPDRVAAHRGLGDALGYIGENDEAIAALRRVLMFEPDHGNSHRMLTTLKKFTARDDDLVAMETVYAREDLSDENRIHIGFGLGKAYEDLGEYRKSMACIVEAAQLKFENSNYSHEDSIALFESIKSTLTAEFANKFAASGNPDPTPIFILGMPRSGTSLAEQILASHPQVFGAGELRFLTQLVSRADEFETDRESIRHLPEMAPEAMRQLGDSYIERIRALSSEARFITDKMPHNFLYIGLIRTILPNARIVRLRRDPADNCLSIFKNYFARGHYYSYDLTSLGRYYRLYLGLMDFWDEQFPGSVFDLSYERLVTEPEHQIAELLEYCDLPWDDSCMQSHKTRRAVKTASVAQVRQPIYRDSVKSSERFREELRPLIEALG